MTGKLFAVGGIVLLVLVVGAAAITGVGPAPGGNSEEIESFPPETPADGSGDSVDDRSGGGSDAGGDDATGDADGETTDVADRPPFTFSIDRVEECGETCRDVTVTLTNERSTAVGDVTVYTRIHAGNGTDGEVVWEGTESVGTLDAGGSATATERIELSLADAYAVRQNDGWVTIRTTVQSDGETVTFTRQRQVG